MKHIFITCLALLGLTACAQSQTINWRAMKIDQKNLVHAQAGWDYGLTYGLGYSRQLSVGVPVIAGVEYSAPAGENLTDDFKIRIGGQAEVLHLGAFSATVKVYSPFRRFENHLATLISFGGEFTGVAGFYKSSWFVAGEFGFDKAIATHIQHSRASLESYGGRQSGWYIPTGGNYNYGVQGGFSFRGNDLSIRIGMVLSQGFKTRPFIPYMAQLGYIRRF